MVVDVELAVGFGIDIQGLVGVHDQKSRWSGAGVREAELVAPCEDVEDGLLGWGLIVLVVVPGQCDQVLRRQHYIFSSPLAMLFVCVFV